MKLRTERIGHGYSGALLGVLALALFMVGSQTVRSQRRLLYQEVRSSLETHASELARRGEVSFLLGDAEQMSGEIERMVQQLPDAQFGLFVTPSGAVMAASGLESLPAEVGSALALPDLESFEASGFIVAYAALPDNDGNVRGHAVIGASTDRVELALQAATARMEVVAVISFLFVFALSRVLLGRIQGLTENLERRVEERTRELQVARDEATAASQLKSEFLANMSHEIRTPMHGVISVADLLATGELDAKQKRWVQTIRRSGFALVAIIDDILDVSKIESGRMTIEEVDFSFRTVIEDVVDLMQERASGAGLALTSKFRGVHLDHLRGDPLRIRQVAMNLVGNAIKFTSEGGVHIEVEGVEAIGDRVRVRCTVRDTGIGIAPEALPHLFEVFTQEDASTTRRFGGTGLGLSISKSLVELMGGVMELESTPGVGSEFGFTLPLETQDLGSRPEPRARPVLLSQHP